MMIVPVLKETHTFYEPEFEDDFCISVVADIGIQDSDGADQFYFSVISPIALKKLLEEDQIISGRGYLISSKFNLKLVRAQISKMLTECIRPTWEEAAQAINRHLCWEYDNIQYETLDEALEKISEQK
ncbi:Imm8 family immunity protein [Brevibacillus laterosporus]|uniref:Imm8 family immunity protein n=1 Tax=Brevibacillus laterosporus TaxID=1465 RepID=UPI001F103BA0|nr:Imm8 family immunity protein [Brevibacillus laterosporus]WNX29243.1 Imm8 family immunity protein [Brevibacillus laterosporus]